MEEKKAVLVQGMKLAYNLKIYRRTGLTLDARATAQNNKQGERSAHAKKSSDSAICATSGEKQRYK